MEALNAMKATLSTKDTVIIGFMLFALFFGAGNMIYPPELGQYAGQNVWKAMGGFLLRCRFTASWDYCDCFNR